MKVLHLPTSVGGNAWGLAQGERSIGLDSTVLVDINSNVNYPCDICLHLEKKSSSVFRIFKKLSTFFRIRSQFDVFHFNFGSSLLHFWDYDGWQLLEVPFYPKKAKLFATYNGCDARQKYPTMQRRCIAPCHNANCYGGGCNSGKKDRIRRKSIEKMSRYVRHIWAVNPDLLYFLPPEKSSFLPYTVCQFDVEPCIPTWGKKLTLVHAPTNREAKGSSYILAACHRLKEKYRERVELIIVENMTHSQAMAAYRQADLIIDQVLAGWYGAFAVEAMLMGKPVVTYIAVEDLKFIPHQMANDLLETCINATPATLYPVLEKCVEDPDFLKQRVQASLEYAHKWHHPAYVARLVKEKYETSLSDDQVQNYP